MRLIQTVLTIVVLSIFGLSTISVTSWAQPAGPDEKAEKRIAFVVGNESYEAGALPTAANDAGLVAQTLQAAGFEVIGARDLEAETLRKSYADFLKRVGDAGPDTVAFVYLAGYGLQYGNDNYYVPIGATVSRDLDIPVEAIRLSDLMGPLNGMNLKARFMVFDAAYKSPFKTEGAPLAGGLALVDASPGSLIAYNAAPGTVAVPGKGNYGVYAQSLAAMLRDGGLPPDEVFDRVRLRVNEETKGGVVPWDSTKIDTAFRFFDRGKDAPPPATAEQMLALQKKPLKDLPVKQAYNAAVARDTVQAYQDFDAVYGGDPLGKRVRVLLAVRREQVTWRRTVSVDTPNAYWSYLSRYPRGPHAVAARLRLQELSAALAPPPSYPVLAYDVGPPPPDEAVYIDQPVVYFDDPSYDFPPPPPPPDYWLPPVPVAFLDLPPPPPPYGLFFLPVPAFVPLPLYFNPPPFVVYPTDNYFYGGNFGGVPYDRRIAINTNGVVNNIHQPFSAGGPPAAAGAARPAGVILPVAAVALGAALAKRGITTPTQLRADQARTGGFGAGAAGGARNALPRNQQLPGTNGRPLPAVTNTRPGAATTPITTRAGRPTDPTVTNAARPGANVRTNAVPPVTKTPTVKTPPRQAVTRATTPRAEKTAPTVQRTRATPEVRTQTPRVQAQPRVQQRIQAPVRQQMRAPPPQFRAPAAFGGGGRPGGGGGGGAPKGGGAAKGPPPKK